jgi:hypothetical protein
MSQDRFVKVRPLPGIKRLAIFALGLLLSACASSSYMGIPLEAGAATPELQELALRARAGDKGAKIDLASKFERGEGVAVDFSKALKLYDAAAKSTGGSQMIFIPSKGGVSATIVNTGPVTPGNPIARDKAEQIAALMSSGSRSGFWPKSFDDAKHSSGAKLRAIIGLCEQSAQDGPLCQSPQYQTLREAVRFESGFRSCEASDHRRSTGGKEPSLHQDVFEAANADDIGTCIREYPGIRTEGLDDNVAQSIWVVTYIAQSFKDNPDITFLSAEAISIFRDGLFENRSIMENSGRSILSYALSAMSQKRGVTYIYADAYSEHWVGWWLRSCAPDALESTARQSNFEISVCRAIRTGRGVAAI